MKRKVLRRDQKRESYLHRGDLLWQTVAKNKDPVSKVPLMSLLSYFAINSKRTSTIGRQTTL